MKRFCYFLVCLFGLMAFGCRTGSNSKQNEHSSVGNFRGHTDHVLIFTGSDWSDEAHDFVTAVMTEELFSGLKQHYTVHHIDLPRVVSKLKKSQVKKNYILFSRYGVTEIPFVVLQTPKNDVYAAELLSDSVKSPKDLIAKIEALTALREPVVTARKRIEHTNGHEKAHAIDSFLSTVLYGYFQRYDSLRLQVPLLDPDNMSGLRGKYLLISADIQAKKCIRNGDVSGACNQYVKTAELSELSAAERQLAWFLAANTYLSAQKDADNAVPIQYLEKSIAADPEGAGVPSMKKMIKELKNEKVR